MDYIAVVKVIFYSTIISKNHNYNFGHRKIFQLVLEYEESENDTIEWGIVLLDNIR